MFNRRRFNSWVFSAFVASASICIYLAVAKAQQRSVAPDPISATPHQRVHDSYDRARGLPIVGTAASPPTAWGQEARTIDGTGNNVANSTWGSAGTRFLRLAPPEYADSYSSPAGVGRPSARAISNAVCTQPAPVYANGARSDFIWQWGQFIDHDTTLATTADPPEPFDILVPTGDPFFDPASTGTQVIALNRSAHDPTSGTGPGNPREQVNVLTAFIDGSNVYGSDAVRAAALRMNDGSGRLKSSAGNLLPFNVDGLDNAGGPDPTFFLAGDVRSNEQLSLTSMHTLFMREHNRLADQILTAEPGLSDEEVYQRARAIVGAEIQVITYHEWLPLLIGSDAIPPYTGYNPSTDPGIADLFNAACYRVGHTMLSPFLKRLDATNNPIPQGNIALRDAFFSPSRLINEGGIDPFLRGLAFQHMQEIDCFVIDDVRNFLFGPPGSGGFDLPSLNIQRGRDHGIASYNNARLAMGFPAAASFADISSDSAVQAAFASVYADINQVDTWPAAISEDHVPGAQVGPLIRAVLADQFTRLRDGDRFWYELFFSGSMLTEIENTRLSDIIRRNTNIGSELQDNVFQVTATAAVPTVSIWGLSVIGVLMLLGGAAVFRPRLSAKKFA